MCRNIRTMGLSRPTRARSRRLPQKPLVFQAGRRLCAPDRRKSSSYQGLRPWPPLNGTAQGKILSKRGTHANGVNVLVRGGIQISVISFGAERGKENASTHTLRLHLRPAGELLISKPKLRFTDCLIIETARTAGHLPLGTFDGHLAKIDGARRL